ncbi:MAG: DNA mismatch repair endonuclease MutL [Chthoniobacteraceae bacterium]
MPRIALLPEHVASQVAAGEVVERPASVVKELVENSIDAGATRIEVAIKRGGSSAIRIVDDGCGMDRDDALLCLERHATSKIRTGEDLATVRTLGFRGEALPSIASVSRFRLTTREKGALAGTEVIVNGGRIETVRDCGEPEGTQIEARSLFFNLPARRKFLRTEQTEASHVEQALHLQAIGHPQIGFTFVRDERVVFQLPPGQSLRERLRDLCGAALVAELLAVPEYCTDWIGIRGQVGKAGVSRSTRQQSIVFLNGRPVENPTLTHALREGYHTALMRGQHPVTFLFLEMDPERVDVNVHPAKREVRFRDPAGVREAVAQALRQALESDRASWSQTFRAAPEPALIPEREQLALRKDWSDLPVMPAPLRGAQLQTPNEPPPEPATTSPKAENFKILGVLGKLYVLMENATGLVLVDQHAAHERVLFEEMRRRMETQGVPTQRLLLPLTLEVSPRDTDWITRHLDVLDRAGLGLEPFGEHTFKIDALPTFLRADDPAQLLRDIIDDLRDTTAQNSRLRLGEDMIAKTVCRHAVKANDVLREPELVRLIQDLLACELPYCCPHGRPTMIQMSYAELEKKFGRIV